MFVSDAVLTNYSDLFFNQFSAALGNSVKSDVLQIAKTHKWPIAPTLRNSFNAIKITISYFNFILLFLFTQIVDDKTDIGKVSIYLRFKSSFYGLTAELLINLFHRRDIQHPIL